MMMDSMMKLADDMFKLELLHYLTVYDIVNMDNACMDHEYRPQLLGKISGVILIGSEDNHMNSSLFKWLGMRQIYWVKMLILVTDFYLHPSSIENDYVDQFRHTQHLIMRGPIIDDMAIFILTRCPLLLSIEIHDCSEPKPQVTDHTLQSLAEYCTGLQSLSLRHCREITDAGFIPISEHCCNLLSLKVEDCSQITDASIISLSTHCTGLHSLNLDGCDQITDTSIISLSTHCTGLQLLNLDGCDQITDASIISISTNCTGLQLLNLERCQLITDTSIISISTHCTGLQSLHLDDCDEITDEKNKLNYFTTKMANQ